MFHPVMGPSCYEFTLVGEFDGGVLATFMMKEDTQNSSLVGMCSMHAGAPPASVNTSPRWLSDFMLSQYVFSTGVLHVACRNVQGQV